MTWRGASGGGGGITTETDPTAVKTVAKVPKDSTADVPAQQLLNALFAPGLDYTNVKARLDDLGVLEK